METRTLGRTGLDISVLSIGGLYTSSLAGGESETRRIMERAFELDPNDLDNLTFLIAFNVFSGRHERSAELIPVLLDRDRMNPFNLWIESLVQCASGRFRDAEQAIAKAREADAAFR